MDIHLSALQSYTKVICCCTVENLSLRLPSGEFRPYTRRFSGHALRQRFLPIDQLQTVKDGLK